jgi:hypothetical protein
LQKKRLKLFFACKREARRALNQQAQPLGKGHSMFGLGNKRAVNQSAVNDKSTNAFC